MTHENKPSDLEFLDYMVIFGSQVAAPNLYIRAIIIGAEPVYSTHTNPRRTLPFLRSRRRTCITPTNNIPKTTEILKQ